MDVVAMFEIRVKRAFFNSFVRLATNRTKPHAVRTAKGNWVVEMDRKSGDWRKSRNESIQRDWGSVNGSEAIFSAILSVLFSVKFSTFFSAANFFDLTVCKVGIFSVNSSMASLNNTGTPTFSILDRIRQDRAETTRTLVPISFFGHKYGVSFFKVCENVNISTYSPRDSASLSRTGDNFGALPANLRIVDLNVRLAWIRDE